MYREQPRILIAEDEKIARIMLERTLVREMGLEVLVAEDGEQAWQMFLAAPDLQFLISDWMMPGCNGLELCRRVRAETDRPYTYFILATARIDQSDLLAGMEAGADDYIPKPVLPAELKARVRAGIRIIQLERTLGARNAELEKALHSAGQVQQGMLPPRRLLDKIHARTGLRLEYKYEACQSLGGDVLGLATPEPGMIVVFLGDVSGHGIPASLSAVSLHTFIQATLRTTHEPLEVARLTNDYCGRELPPSTYATLVYLRIWTEQRKIDAVIAGHPPLLRIGPQGLIERYPALFPGLGMWPEKPETEDIAQLFLGEHERLIACTDGVIETRNTDETFYSEEHLTDAVLRNAGAPLPELLEHIMADLNTWRGTSLPAEDDITLFALQMD